MFEPIGGSAPKYTGQGVINPLAAICAMQMMLITLAKTRLRPRRGIGHVYYANKLKSLAAGRMGYSTSEVGDLVRQESRDALGMTIAEKDLAAHSGKSSVAPEELINVKVTWLLRASLRKSVFYRNRLVRRRSAVNLSSGLRAITARIKPTD